MGTKNNPGDFDCYENAEPDEPMFILLGRDGMAPSLVKMWADARKRDGEDKAKVSEAVQCAQAMERWLVKLGKEEKPVLPGSIYEQALAWVAVFNLCLELGMECHAHDGMNGSERVVSFVRKLAEKSV